MEDFLMKELVELQGEIGLVDGATEEDRAEMSSYLDEMKADFFDAFRGEVM